eukprot:2700900-Amphidinium_carterae.1
MKLSAQDGTLCLYTTDHPGSETATCRATIAHPQKKPSIFSIASQCSREVVSEEKLRWVSTTAL